MTTIVQVTIDGLRPDAIEPADCPTIKSLMKQGAYSLNAKSVVPSLTLPCHISMFYSVVPERHGIVDNTWHPFARPLPSLVDIFADSGLRCAFFINWEPLRNLCQPDKLRLLYAYNTAETDLIGSDKQIAQQAAYHLRNDPFDYYFVYLGTLDMAGHHYGWMSQEYLHQIAVADNALQIVLDALPNDAMILVQSDHGGHGRTHGTASDEDILIPWIIAGQGIRENYPIQSAISLLNTAPTLCHIAGVQPSSQWDGKIIDEIFLKT